LLTRGAMLTTFLFALIAMTDPAPAASPVAREEECDALAPGPGHESTRIGRLHVLARTAGDGPFVSDLPHDTLIVCPRSSIVPAPNDWKVPAAGYMLYLAEAGVTPGRARIGGLDHLSGSFRYIMVRGNFTREEGELIQQRIDQFNSRTEGSGGQHGKGTRV
jgi:hypothetical protein